MQHLVPKAKIKAMESSITKRRQIPARLYFDTKKSRNSIKDAKAYNFASIGSNHRIVSGKLRLSLRSNHNSTMRKIKYDRKMLKEDDELQEIYTLTVKNRFPALTIEN